MSTYTKDKMAFKVIATKENKTVAEFVFEFLKEAMKFELGMRKKGYKTDISRIQL